MSEKELAVTAFVIQFGPAVRQKGRKYMRKILLFAEENRAAGHSPDYQDFISRTALFYEIAPSAITSAINRWVRHSCEQDSLRKTWNRVAGLDPMGAPPPPKQAIRLLCDAYLSGSASN